MELYEAIELLNQVNTDLESRQEAAYATAGKIMDLVMQNIHLFDKETKSKFHELADDLVSQYTEYLPEGTDSGPEDLFEVSCDYPVYYKDFDWQEDEPDYYKTIFGTGLFNE